MPSLPARIMRSPSLVGKASYGVSMVKPDPMRPGITGINMWVNLARENFPEAVKWAEIAARTPWAHAGMAWFAAMSHWLNGDTQRSQDWMGEVRRRNPQFNREQLMTIVPTSDPYFRNLVARVAGELLP